MAYKKPQTKDERQEEAVGELISGWTSVNKHDDPAEWKAWITFRKSIGCKNHGDSFTVPSKMPPTEPHQIRAYCETVQQIRNIIEWKGTRATLPMMRLDGV